MTKGKASWFRYGFIMLLSVVYLLGWLGVQPTLAGDHETVLLDSGFKKWTAKSPQQQDMFQTVPSDKIVTFKKKNKTAHASYHPQSGALYVGDDTAYQNYLKNAPAKGITPKARQDADTPNDPQFWDMWEDSQGGG